MHPDSCPFMRIPTELRLLIYSFALLETPVITIGTAELAGSHPDIIHRLYGDHRKPTAGIPSKHEPVIESRYNASLLSLTNPAFVHVAPATSVPPERLPSNIHTAHSSLLRVNKQIHEELTSHSKLWHDQDMSLFVSFPHGLHLLTTLTPGLVRHTRSIHLAGAWTSRTFDTARAVCLPLSRHHHPALDETYNGNITPNTTKELGNLILALFGPSPMQSSIERFEMRVYYPGSNSYTAVWGDDNSPVCVALRNICAGKIGMEVWRGQRGTGVYLTVVPPRVDEEGEAAKKKRVISTVWRRLEEGRRGEPPCGSWVIDPKWPQWEEGNGAEDATGGDTIVSVATGSAARA